MRRRSTRQKGSAIVEAALVITPTLAIFLFILQMGIMLARQEYYTERARAGARYAATAAYNTSTIKNVVCYGSTTPPTGATTGLFGLSPSMVTVSRSGTAGAWSDLIKVTISGHSAVAFVPWLARTIPGKTIVVTIPAQSLGGTT